MDAFIFVPALAASAVFGFIFALFAAHYFLTVLQSTGSGARKVTWGSEPILDSYWKMFYLGWLIVLWLGPAIILGRVVAARWDAPGLRLAVPLAVLWVCYPVSQLSSLSGPTIWLPLHPDVLFRLMKKPGVVLGFMTLSGLTLCGLGIGLHWAFFARGLGWLVLGCPLLVIGSFLYARLLGRLAFVLSYTRPFLLRKKKYSSRANPEPTHFPAPVAPTDEEELRPISNRPKNRTRVVAEAVAVEPAIASSPPPRPQSREPSRQWTAADDDRTPYLVREVVPIPECEQQIPFLEPSADEMRLISRDNVPRKPRYVWTGEVFKFLEQAETWTAVLTLSGWCFLFDGMVRVARAFNPVAGEP